MNLAPPLAIEKWNVPDVPADQILVKIESCGVCHTDLHAAEGDWRVKPSLPFVPGHEGVGHVVATEAFDRCIAARTVCVVVVLPWSIWPIARHGIDTLSAADDGNAPLSGSGCDTAFPPDSKRLGPKRFEDAAWQEVALDVEGIVDSGVDRQKALG